MYKSWLKKKEGAYKKVGTNQLMFLLLGYPSFPVDTCSSPPFTISFFGFVTSPYPLRFSTLTTGIFSTIIEPPDAHYFFPRWTFLDGDFGTSSAYDRSNWPFITCSPFLHHLWIHLYPGSVNPRTPLNILGIKHETYSTQNSFVTQLDWTQNFLD